MHKQQQNTHMCGQPTIYINVLTKQDCFLDWRSYENRESKHWLLAHMKRYYKLNYDQLFEKKLLKWYFVIPL